MQNPDPHKVYLEALMQGSDPRSEKALSTTPQNISELISRLCKSLVANEQPSYIDVDPLDAQPFNECFKTVDEKIARDGGSKQHGWMIWEWPSIMIEAEFHAVWVSPDGDLVDVSPKMHGEKKILFLPDPKRKYQGIDVDNTRIALLNDQLTRDFFAGAQKFRALLNSGKPTGRDGEVSVSEGKLQKLETTRLLIQSMLACGLTSNDACLCQSGKAYKSCHGLIFRRL